LIEDIPLSRFGRKDLEELLQLEKKSLPFRKDIVERTRVWETFDKNKDLIQLRINLDSLKLIDNCLNRGGGTLQISERKDLMEALKNCKKLGLKRDEKVNLIRILFVLFEKKLNFSEDVKLFWLKTNEPDLYEILTLIEDESEIAQGLDSIDKKIVDRILFLRKERIKIEELLEVMKIPGLIRSYNFKHEKEKLLKDAAEDPDWIARINKYVKEKEKLQDQLDYLVSNNAEIFGFPEKDLNEFGTKAKLEVKKV
jgi:hypothetical protein